MLGGFTGFYRVLPGFTGFYRVLLGFTGFYWVLPSFGHWMAIHEAWSISPGPLQFPHSSWTKEWSRLEQWQLWLVLRSAITNQDAPHGRFPKNGPPISPHFLGSAVSSVLCYQLGEPFTFVNRVLIRYRIRYIVDHSWGCYWVFTGFFLDRIKLNGFTWLPHLVEYFPFSGVDRVLKREDGRRKENLSTAFFFFSFFFFPFQ